MPAKSRFSADSSKKLQILNRNVIALQQRVSEIEAILSRVIATHKDGNANGVNSSEMETALSRVIATSGASNRFGLC